MNCIYCTTTYGEGKNSAENLFSKAFASQEPKQYATEEEKDLDLYIPTADELQAPRKAARRKRFLRGVEIQTEHILNVDSMGNTSCGWMFSDNALFEEFEEQAIDLFVNQKGYRLEPEVLPDGTVTARKILCWSLTPSSKV